MKRQIAYGIFAKGKLNRNTTIDSENTRDSDGSRRAVSRHNNDVRFRTEPYMTCSVSFKGANFMVAFDTEMLPTVKCLKYMRVIYNDLNMVTVNII